MIISILSENGQSRIGFSWAGFPYNEYKRSNISYSKSSGQSNKYAAHIIIPKNQEIKSIFVCFCGFYHFLSYGWLSPCIVHDILRKIAVNGQKNLTLGTKNLDIFLISFFWLSFRCSASSSSKVAAILPMVSSSLMSV